MKRVRFADLFQGLDDPAELGFNPRASEYSGTEVEIRGYLSPLHEGARFALVNATGECPDCGPVASIHLPGFAPASVPSGATAVRLRGRLEYGFAIADDGYASFLRLQDATLVAGIGSLGAALNRR
jgi:hypothetical protein